MKHYLQLLMVLSLVVFSGFNQAMAADTDTAEIDTLDEVVVTATKTEEKRRDIPNAVIVKDAIDIAESGAKSVGELLANDPGIDFRTYGDYGGAAEGINIRGFSDLGTQVFVNGINVNSPSLATADVSRIPLNTIERIEVVKGPGSLLYGTGAMGGTINIITKRPRRDMVDLKVGAGYGTENAYQLSAENGMFVMGDWGYYVTGTRQETDGFRDNGDLTHNDLSLNLVLDKGDALDISLYGDYIDRQYGLPGVKPPPGTQPFAFNGQVVYSADSASLLNRNEEEDKHLALRIKSKPYQWLGFALQSEYTNMESYNLNRYYTTFPAPGVPGTKSWVTNEVLGVEGNAEIKPFKTTGLLVGVDYRDYDYKNKGITLDGNGAEVGGSLSTTKAGVHTKAAFVEAQYRPSPYFKVLAGARQQYHSYFGSEGIPRFGLVVNPSTSTVVKASHGKHFRAPSMNDLFWPDDGFTRGNPDLDPETGWNTDVTLEQSLLSNKFFFSATYFKWDLDDKINWAENPSFPTVIPGVDYYTPSNVDQYEAEGMEFGAKIGPYKDVILALSYTWLDATERQAGGVERQALYTPEGLFKGSLIHWSSFGLTTTVSVRYTSDRPGRYPTVTDKTASQTLAQYWTTDLKLEQLLFDHWKIAFRANNLFDQDYDSYVGFFSDSTGTTTYEGYPGAGRSIFGGVTYEF